MTMTVAVHISLLQGIRSLKELESPSTVEERVREEPRIRVFPCVGGGRQWVYVILPCPGGREREGKVFNLEMLEEEEQGEDGRDEGGHPWA